ncbi:MAG: alpha/beta hydrolase [Hyphomicrobiaceae bacterium]
MAASGASIDYETEYNNLARVPEYPQIHAQLLKDSAAAREVMSGELDIPYGDTPRERYDLFTAKQTSGKAPLAVFIHGGVWQRGDRKDYSLYARELAAKGVDVAMPSHTLCPQATVAQIYDELRRFMKALWEKTGRHPTVVGHSVGGAMAAAMLATDWSAQGGVPADLVRSAYAISGVFEIEPYVHTSYNKAVGLDVESARAASPALWPPPPKDRVFVAAVGGSESREFLRQSIDQAARWSAAGVKAECVVIPGANHFTVLDDLTRPESAMLHRIKNLAKDALSG